MRQKTRKTRKVMRLRLIRRQREMTQGQLAKRVGVRTATICDIEKGRQEPSLRLASDIAAIFKLPVDEVFQYVELSA